ncbi:hypothetical protein LOK49_LG08G01268, partial [Camellia lanceoleosa]
EKGSNEIALKAMGRAINKTVMIAELIEVVHVGNCSNFPFPLPKKLSIFVFYVLHANGKEFYVLEKDSLVSIENTSIGSMDITDTWKPLEEGLSSYQTPIPVNQGKPWNEYDYGEGSPNMRGRGHGGRGRGRGRVWSLEYPLGELDSNFDQEYIAQQIEPALGDTSNRFSDGTTLNVVPYGN